MLSAKIKRNLMKRPPLHRTASSLTSKLRSHIILPPYIPPTEPFPSLESCAPPETSDGPVFITARFRSGSTLLWQIFLRLQGFTAYYEPLNERRWFNQDHRGEKVDTTHRGVSDYAINYENLAHLEPYFREDWTYHKLALGQKSKAKELACYIEALIKAAPLRPVLQFNRVDFRLPFLKASFPDAQIVHLRRQSRDTWRSTLLGLKNDPRWTLTSFEEFCRFYLLAWYRDLSLTFPFMLSDADKTHPYEIHYLLSRLSELFALRDADLFLSYEELDQDFTGHVTALTKALGVEDVDQDLLTGLHEPKKSGYDHSADSAFYQELEETVEKRLQQALG